MWRTLTWLTPKAQAQPSSRTQHSTSNSCQKERIATIYIHRYRTKKIHSRPVYLQSSCAALTVNMSIRSSILGINFSFRSGFLDLINVISLKMCIPREESTFLLKMTSFAVFQIIHMVPTRRTKWHFLFIPLRSPQTQTGFLSIWLAISSNPTCPTEMTKETLQLGTKTEYDQQFQALHTLYILELQTIFSVSVQPLIDFCHEQPSRGRFKFLKGYYFSILSPSADL